MGWLPFLLGLVQLINFQYLEELSGSFHLLMHSSASLPLNDFQEIQFSNFFLSEGKNEQQNGPEN